MIGFFQGTLLYTKQQNYKRRMQATDFNGELQEKMQAMGLDEIIQGQ